MQLFVFAQASPEYASLRYSFEILIIVVIGGVGSKYGAVVGAFLYVLLDSRLIELANAPWVAALPPVLHVPLSEPAMLIGIIFILFVFFAPGGLTSVANRIARALRSRRRRKSEDDEFAALPSAGIDDQEGA